MVCDTPARAFLKSVKGHTGFFSCERCETRGMTVKISTASKTGVRIFPETDAPLRTRKSFKKQTQPEHHRKDMQSLLLRLPQFDPVKDFALDYMHMLRLGVMKSLLGKWVEGEKGSRAMLSSTQRNLCTILLKNSLSVSVPLEFQRKTFELNDLSNWKATQYRFFCYTVVALLHASYCRKESASTFFS